MNKSTSVEESQKTHSHKSHFVDLSARIIVSSIYRIVLASFGWWLLSIFRNSFELYNYVIITSLYLLFFFATPGSKKSISFLRLLNDYVFIFLILLGKDINAFTFTFLLLPILNSPNHTGNRRTVLPYLFSFLVLALVLQEKLTISYIIPFLFISIIDFLENIRSKLLRFGNFMSDMIDDFFVVSDNRKRANNIYSKFKQFLNVSKFRYLFVTDEIAYFRFEKNRFLLLDSSVFIYNYSLSLSDEDIWRIKNKKIVRYVEVAINNRSYNKTLLIPIILDKEVYVYLFLIQSKVRLWVLCQFYLKIFFSQILLKLSVILKLTKQITEERDAYIATMKSKLYYVNNAIFAMHFLRNKFTPIKNYLTMVGHEESVDLKKINQFKSILKDESKQAKRSTEEIIQRTNQILEKTQNPFLISELSEVSVRKVIDTMQKIWEEYFDNSTVEFDEKILPIINDNFILNLEALEVLGTDIIANTAKYNDGWVKIKFECNNTGISIVVENNIKNISQNKHDELKKLSSDFNNVDLYEMNKRKSHGLAMVKSFLLQMKINHSLVFDSATEKLELRLVLDLKK